jgi:hypothetical protein
MPTVALRPIELLTRDWRVQSRSRASRDALALLAHAEPLVAALRGQDLGDLVAALLGPAGARRTGAGRPERASRAEQGARVVQAMLRSAHVHPLVPRALLQGIVPGLIGIARRLTWGDGGEWADAATFFVDVLATAWEVIDEWSGQDRAYAVLDVLSAVRCRLRRRIVRTAATRKKEVSERGRDAAARRQVSRSHDSGIDELARALEVERGRTIAAADASVLYAHRVLGYSIAELSQSTGRSRRYLAGLRDRAADALTA